MFLIVFYCRRVTARGMRGAYAGMTENAGHGRAVEIDESAILALFLRCVRPAGRTYLEVQVLCAPDRGKR